MYVLLPSLLLLVLLEGEVSCNENTIHNAEEFIEFSTNVNTEIVIMERRCSWRMSSISLKRLHRQLESIA